MSLTRRSMIKVVGGVCMAGTFASRSLASAMFPPALRYVFIGKQRSAESDAFLNAVDKHLVARDSRWRARLECLYLDSDMDAIESFIAAYGAATEAVEWPILIGVPSDFDTHQSVEVWSNAWLAHADDITDACYPISGGWWSVEGDWNPTAEKVRMHLFESPNHAEGNYTREWLNLLNRSELQSVHSDHHREMIGQGSVHWGQVNTQCPATP